MEKIKTKEFQLNVSDNDLLEKMKKTIFQNYRVMRFLRNIGLDDEAIEKNVVKIFDFAKDFEYCEKCPGLDNCKKENPHLCTIVVYKNHEVDRELRPCKKLIERLNFEGKFLFNDINDELVDTNSLFDEDSKNKQETNAKMFLKMSKEKNYNWYYFCYDDYLESIEKGYNFGVTLLQDLGSQIAYINFPARIKELTDLNFSKTKESKNEFDKKMEIYCNAPILVLEGFGDEFVNDYIRDSIVLPIINTRAMKRLPTVFISKYHINELKDIYATSKTGEIRAKQMAKQIEMLCEYEFDNQ